MPPRRKAVHPQPTRTTRRTTRQTRSSNVNHGVPSIYREMLAEVPVETFHDVVADTRPTKRRKLSEASEKIEELFGSPAVSPKVEEPEPDSKPQQIIFDDFEDSEESDVEFEDVDLDNVVESEDEPEKEPLRLDLSKQTEVTPKKVTQRRKPLTKAEREIRLDVHKWHFMSLLLHQLSRNVWCENEQVHAILKPLIPKKIIALLHVDESQPSYQRNHSFMKGLEEVCAIWRREWSITARGLRRAYWNEAADALEAFDEAEDPIDFDDFMIAARTREGSRDLGAQMFCALLRSVAAETRLVFSLQVLPFSGEAKNQTSTPKKSPYINAAPQTYGSSKSKFKKKKIVDSPHPIFWVEVFNSATTSWIPLDPIVRNTINKPKTQFEPPASDNLNSMNYVIAFEDDNTARDVTRRYTQWFNAKTRKSRVESTRDGEKWLAKAMGVFRRQVHLPRDDVENDQLMQRVASEGMPKNVQDFRQHPIYVLERHIRRNEVIHPRREVGKISAAKNAKLEIVFRRQDVHICRSADAWYRRGRDVKLGEQPLKRVMPTVKRGARSPSEDAEDEDHEGVALYAEYQTQIYEPPSVVSGRIPKNAYGNLDVYVPSMIPAGAVHVMHPLASQAAKILGIDYTEAVTGFDFKGRQGTAVINGCVVASKFTAAVTTTIEGLEWQGTREAQAERSRLVLTVWKRMLTALRIRDRIEQDYGEKKNDSDDESAYSESDHGSEEAGGFMLEADETAEKANEQIVSMQSMKSKLPVILPQEVIQQPIKIVISPHKLPEPGIEPKQSSQDELFENSSDMQGSDEGGGFVLEDDQDGGGGGFMPEDDNDNEDLGGGFVVDNDMDAGVSGGGFVPESADGVGGGFIPDDDEEEEKEQPRSKQEAPHPFTSRTNDHPPSPPPPPPQNNKPAPLPISKPDPSPSKPHAARPNPVNESSIPDNDSDIESETSLLSHDPEEDDQEPEWLDEAMEQ